MTVAWPEVPGYDVQAEIGRGGMGVVYRVRRHSTGRVQALKMILHSQGASFADLARFRMEAEALAYLNHPNIINIRDIGWCAGHPYFVMDYAENGSLKQSIARGTRTPRWSAELVRTLAGAMQHAHERGMLHRDLKPANVLIMEDGRPVVTDFGLVKFATPMRTVSEVWATISVSVLDDELARFARELGGQYQTPADPSGFDEDDFTNAAWAQCAGRTGISDDGTKLRSVVGFLKAAKLPPETVATDLDDLTDTGAVMGSPNYMAPEQATGDLSRIGPRTDVYALGGILYELLAGRPPFRSDSIRNLLALASATPPTPPGQLAPGLSADLETVCLRCLEKSPDDRYESAAALVDDLFRFLDGYTPRARPRRTADAGPPALTVPRGPTSPPSSPPTTSHNPAPSTAGRWTFPWGRTRTIRGSD